MSKHKMDSADQATSEGQAEIGNEAEAHIPATPTKQKKRDLQPDDEGTPTRSSRTKRIKESNIHSKAAASGCNEDGDGGSIPENLTMTNVKSIIYNVIKNADVQKMLTNTLEEDTSKHQEATYEPKMTRAKMKQMLSEDGNIPYPWPLSPAKLFPRQAKLNFTDLEFPDDDDDEDYNPERDPAAAEELKDMSGIYSDEDNDSVVSSHVSDVGSPSCSTLSPQVAHNPSLFLPDISAKHNNLPQTITCMGPPPPVQTSKETEKNFFDALDQLDLSDTIARRTRSQQPLKHTSIHSIEAEFVPPDITMDMYGDPDLEDEDPEWKDFLSNLFKNTDVPTDDEDDPEADPEYNVLAEAEPEADEDDSILPVRVTKNEINSLMEELREAENHSQDDDSQDAPMRFNKPAPINKLTPVSALLARQKSQKTSTPDKKAGQEDMARDLSTKKSLLPEVSSFERSQLSRQMECYVQILTQQAIVGQQSAPKLAEQSRQFLRELKTFSTTSQAKEQTSFAPCNLEPALTLLETYKSQETKAGQTTPVSDQTKVLANPLTDQEKKTLSESAVFMYPELLPSAQFMNSKHGRLIWQPAEDILICMGMEEFKSDRDQKNRKPLAQLIRKYLLPNHTKQNISQRMSNECKQKNRKKSIIGLFKYQSIVPPAIFAARAFARNKMAAPVTRLITPANPSWLNTILCGQAVALSLVAAPIAIPPSSNINLTILPSPLKVADTSKQPESSSAGGTPCKPNEVVTVLAEDTDKAATKDQPELDTTGKETETKPEMLPTELTRKPAVSGVLGILSNLSAVFSSGDDRANVGQETGVVLVTPTKKIVALVKSPHKAKSPKHPKIAAAPHKTPEKVYQPLDPNWKVRNNSPRRQELRSKVQAIVPKSFVATVFLPSPTKKAAKAISEKALNRASQKTKYQSPLKTLKSPQKPQTSITTNLKTSGGTRRQRKSSKCKSPVDNDSDDDSFAALLEATSTTKAKCTKKHRYIACLASDIVETDPMRIEREDLFSRWYVDKVKEALGENSPEYMTFLEALINFGKQKRNPASFFDQLRTGVLKNRQDLLDGFAAFLLPTQAVACGERCYKACIQFNQARKFLRRMEVYFGANSKMFQKLVKALSSCSPTKSNPSPTQGMRDSITSLLKHHPPLLDEFSTFFADAAPPKRHKADYEELDLTEMDEDTVIDKFEEMEIPEIEETNATHACKCSCHSDQTRTKHYHNRRKHCDNCKIAVIHSRLFIHAGPGKGLRPAYIRYLNPVPSDYEEEDSDIDYESPMADAVGSPDIKVYSPCAGITALDNSPVKRRLSSESSTEASSSEKPVPNWTRNEDQFILEALQQSDSLSLSEDALQSLRIKLKERHVYEIKERFDTLVQLLTHELGDDSDSTR